MKPLRHAATVKLVKPPPAAKVKKAKKAPDLEAKCCCGCAYGDHYAKEPHACIQHRGCTRFRRPLAAGDLPDFWILKRREKFNDDTERNAYAESAGASIVYDDALSSVGAFDFDLS